MSSRITVAEQRAKVFADLTPIEREIYECFTLAIVSIYGTKNMPSCFRAMKGLVSVMQVHVNNYSAGIDIEEFL